MSKTFGFVNQMETKISTRAGDNISASVAAFIKRSQREARLTLVGGHVQVDELIVEKNLTQARLKLNLTSNPAKK